MKIAQITPIWFPVPPQKFGGLENVAGNLIKGLIEDGHSVILYGFSTENWVQKNPYLKEPPLNVDWLKNKNIELENFINAINDSNDFDILHFHVSTDYFPLMLTSFSSKPTLITIHNFDPLSEDNFILKKYQNNLVFPNQFSKNFLPDNQNIQTVYHGINSEEYVYSDQKEDYLVYLSRIEPKKGILDAIKVAKELEKKLIILGPIPPMQKDFFALEVKPLLGENIIYAGEADLALKNKYLSKAKALIFPTYYNETFGLVAAEAMACGTPVIGYTIGALPEVIEHGKTGFLANNNVEDLINVAKDLFSMSEVEYRQMSKNRRERAETKFSVQKMTKEYIKSYNQVIEEFDAKRNNN